MRSYYSAKGIERSCPSSPNPSKDLHWNLMSSALQGLHPSYRPDLRASLTSAVGNRCIKSLFDQINTLDSLTQKYEYEKPDLRTVRSDRMLASFLKKFPFANSPFDKKEAALSALKKAEAQCAQMNNFIRSHRDLVRSDPVIIRARKLIHDVLGDFSPDVMNEIGENVSHGPGSTLTHNGNRTTPFYKMSTGDHSCTSRAAPYAMALLRTHTLYWHKLVFESSYRTALPPPDMSLSRQSQMIFWDKVKRVEEEKVTFVPKDGRKDRPIAIGASLNMLLQLGVKTYMEDRLKRVGVDLTDQTRNQNLAFAGSKFHCLSGQVNLNQYSTIDLASASDTISLELVYELLPRDWFGFLADLRHDCGSTADGSSFYYEKFSAMGNGYTFPLESMIFWALSRASIEHEVGYDNFSADQIGVYGDDIIIRRRFADSVIGTLERYGFSVNTEKSFVSGPFKESCGSDYYEGDDVRSFYLKRGLNTYGDIYFLCNSIAEVIDRWGPFAPLTQIFEKALSVIPKKNRRYQPLKGIGDNALSVPYSYLCSLGLTPWLRKSEISNLRGRNVLGSDFCHSHLAAPVFIETYPVARTFPGSQYQRYLTALFFYDRLPDHTWIDPLDKVTSSTHEITRRKSVNYVTRLNHCSSWDSDYSFSQLRRHPVNWIRHNA